MVGCMFPKLGREMDSGAITLVVSEKSYGWVRAQSGVSAERREGAHCGAGKNPGIYGITREEGEQKTLRQTRQTKQDRQGRVI